MKADPCQGCGAELYRYVRTYASVDDAFSDGSQSISTEAEDLGSLSSVKFQRPGMFCMQH
jgi:hypothetical protein